MHHVLFGAIALIATIFTFFLWLSADRKITSFVLGTATVTFFMVSIFGFLLQKVQGIYFDQIVIEEQISEKQFSLCAFPADDEVYMVIDGDIQIFCYEDDGLPFNMKLNAADTDPKFGEQPSIKVSTSVKRYKHQWKFLYYNSTEFKNIYEVEIPENSIAFEIPTS